MIHPYNSWPYFCWMWILAFIHPCALLNSLGFSRSEYFCGVNHPPVGPFIWDHMFKVQSQEYWVKLLFMHKSAKLKVSKSNREGLDQKILQMKISKSSKSLSIYYCQMWTFLFKFLEKINEESSRILVIKLDLGPVCLQEYQEFLLGVLWIPQMPSPTWFHKGNCK